MRIALYLLLTLIFLLPQVTTAQTPVALDGLNVIAERQYIAEGADEIDTSSEGVMLVTARVYLLDEPEAAESTWETLVAAQTIEDDLPEDDDSFTYEKIELEDVGDRAVVLNLSAKISESETGVFRTIMIQQGTTIVTVNAIAGSTEAVEIADSIAKAMIQREPGDGDSTYDGMGASTGGVWEVFLPADADELAGLDAMADRETHPAE